MLPCAASPSKTATPASGPGRKAALVCLLLAALVLAVFAQSTRFGFVNLDDGKFVEKNNHVLRGLSWENLRWVLTAGIGMRSTDADYWRPVSMTSHMVDVQLFGLNAGAHHAMNVGIHLAAVICLFLVFRSMTGALWRSFFVAAVFAIHPLHVESVAWVTERKDVLSGLFFVLTLGAYLRLLRRRFAWGNYLLVVLLFALGLMSKPIVVTLPCVLLLLDYWPLERFASVPRKRLLLEKAPLFVMSAVAGMVTTTGPGCVLDDKLAAVPWYLCAANAFVSYATYLRQTLWPTSLACFYPHPHSEVSLIQMSLSLAVLAGVSAWVFQQRRRRYLTVGWLWYLGVLVPVIGFLQAGSQARADRYTYLPLIGLAIMAAWGAADWAGSQTQRQRLLAWFATVILALLAVGAFRQAIYWKDSQTLWTRAIQVTGENSRAQYHFGNALADAGRTDEAIIKYRESLRIDPDYPDAHTNLGSCLAMMGKTEEGLEHLHRAIELEPNLAFNHFNIGNVHLRAGQIDAAIASFEKSLAIDPGLLPAHNNLGVLLFQLGRTEEAIRHLTKVLDLSPTPASAHSNLGVVLLKSGRIREAMSHYETALRLNPNETAALSNLAWVLATSPDPALRDGSRALELAKRARAMPGGANPDVAEALAAAQAETGHFTEALEAAEDAIGLATAARNDDKAGTIRRERDSYWRKQPWRDETIREGTP